MPDVQSIRFTCRLCARTSDSCSPGSKLLIAQIPESELDSATSAFVAAVNYGFYHCFQTAPLVLSDQQLLFVLVLISDLFLQLSRGWAESKESPVDLEVPVNECPELPWPRRSFLQELPLLAYMLPQEILRNG
jgi:hypothetical protein